MPAIALPTIIPQITATLELTSGTYAQLVSDTLGDDPVDGDPTLAQADEAQTLLDGAGPGIPGIADTIAALSTQQGTLVPNAGSAIKANVAAARAAVDASANDIIASTAIIPNPTNPTQPNIGTPANPGTGFIAGTSSPQGNYNVKYAGFNLGGTPAVGDDLSMEIDGVSANAPLQFFIPSAVFPQVGMGQSVWTVAHQANGLDATVAVPDFEEYAFIANVDVDVPAAGFYYISITVQANSISRPYVVGIYFTAA